MIGDVLSAHGQVYLVAGVRPVPEIEQESRDPAAGVGLTEEPQIAFRSIERLLNGAGVVPARYCGRQGPSVDEIMPDDLEVRKRISEELARTKFEPEDLPRDGKVRDLATTISKIMAKPNESGRYLIPVLRKFTLSENNSRFQNCYSPSSGSSFEINGQLAPPPKKLSC